MAEKEAWVFNCHYNGLSVIQALGRQGVTVRALDPGRGIGTRSRYAKYEKVPDPLVDESGFIEALWRLRESTGQPPVLIPTNDHWAEALARHKTNLDKAFHCCVSDDDIVSLLLNKERFGRWAQSVGLSVPYVWSIDEALSDIEQLPFPVAVKANARRRAGHSVEWSRAANRLRFRSCDTPEQLKETIQEANKAGVTSFVQQVVRGRSDAMRTIGLYACNGKILALVYGKKLRGFPPGFGDCIVGQANSVPDWALKMAEKICRKLEYTGIAEIEVMVEEATGSRYLIEVNPRSWSWIGVTAPAGLDLPGIAYRNLAKNEHPENTQYGCNDGEPAYYAKALSDFPNTLLWYRFTDAKDWVMSPRQWWRSFKGKNGVFAEISRDDPTILFYAFIQSAKPFIGNVLGVLRGKRF